METIRQRGIPEQEEIGDDDINEISYFEMKMDHRDFEAKYDNENDTEENLMADLQKFCEGIVVELRRNRTVYREQKAINPPCDPSCDPYDEPMRQLTPEKLRKGALLWAIMSSFKRIWSFTSRMRT